VSAGPSFHGGAAYGWTGVAAWIWHGRTAAVAIARSSLMIAVTGFGIRVFKNTKDFGIAFPRVE
jgi:hypothetical protein